MIGDERVVSVEVKAERKEREAAMEPIRRYLFGGHSEKAEEEKEKTNGRTPCDANVPALTPSSVS
jgi:hypothetical protein